MSISISDKLIRTINNLFGKDIMSKKYNRMDPEVLLVKQERILTIQFLVKDKVIEHEMYREDRYVYPERSEPWNNFSSKYLHSDFDVPSKKELQEIALKGGAK